MKFFKTMAMAMVMVVYVILAGTASADDPSLYYSLHDPSQLYYYCSKDFSLGGILQFPCYSPYPYYNQQYYTGVKARINPDDIKIVCHLNPTDATTCGSMTQTTFDFGGSVTPSSISSKFRLFIPPGAVNVTVQYYVARDAQMAVLSRFGQPPTGEMANYPVTTIKAAPFTVSDYWSGEHPVMNTDGLITPISNDTPNNDFLQSLITTVGNTGGGWLYMKLLPYTNANIQLIKFTLTVKLDIFRAWYNKVNAISGYWDSMGNPLPISSQGTVCTPPSAGFTASVSGGQPVSSGSGVSLSITAGQTVNFSSTSGATLSWNFGDTASGTNNTDSGPNVAHTYASAGNYTATMTASNGSCSSSTTLSIAANQNSCTSVNVNFSTSPNPPNITPNQSILFTNKSSGTVQNWLWDFGDAGSDTNITTSTGFSPNPVSHIYIKPGNYIVTLAAKNANNAIISSSQQVVNVVCSAGTVTADFTVPSNINVGQSITFTNNSIGANTFVWAFSDVNGASVDSSCTSVNNSKQCTFTMAGNYIATLTATDSNGCISVKSMPFHVNQAAIGASLTVPGPIAPNQDVTFYNNSDLSLNSSWTVVNKNNNQIISGCSPSADKKILTCSKTIAPGTYRVTLTATDINGYPSSSQVDFVISDPQSFAFKCDVNGDGKPALEEVIYLLQVITALRP